MYPSRLAEQSSQLVRRPDSEVGDGIGLEWALFRPGDAVREATLARTVVASPGSERGPSCRML
jgi:hypothetical protein